MNLKTIQKLADAHTVRLQVLKERGKRVIGLHGFKSDIESVTRKCMKSYWVEWTDTGAYLYSTRATW